MQTLYIVSERKLPFTGYNRSLYKIVVIWIDESATLCDWFWNKRSLVVCKRVSVEIVPKA